MSFYVEIIKAVSIITASATAIYGVNAWRREYVGRRRIELIEDVLTLFYEAKLAINSIRWCVQFENEGSSRKPKEGETPEDKKVLDLAYITIERYLKRQDLFDKLYALRFRFMACFGRQVEIPFLDLNKIIGEIMNASHALARLWKPPSDSRSMTEDAINKRAEQIQKYEEVIWWKGTKPEEDPIVLHLDSIIKEIETIADRYIRSDIAANRAIKTRLAELSGKIKSVIEWCKKALMS